MGSQKYLVTKEDLECAIHNLQNMYDGSLDKDDTYLIAVGAIQKQLMLQAWIEQIQELDIDYNSSELASILKDFLVKEK